MQRYILSGVMLLVAATAAAEGVSYNYVQGGYQSVSIDGGPDGDGFGIGGSLDFGNNWYGFVNYGKASFDFGIDLDELAVGAGYHVDLTENTDFFGTLAYIDVSAGADGFGSIGENGLGVTIGVRGMVSEKLELKASASYVDFGNGADGTSLGVAGWHSFGGDFALGISADFDENVSAYGIGVRWYFDK